MGTLNNYLIKPVIMAGLAAVLSSCPRAQAESKDPYSFDKVGTKIAIPDCKDSDVTSVYAEDLNGDGKLDIIAGTRNCGAYVFENKVPEKSPGK